MNFEILRKMQFELSGLLAYPQELQSSKEIKPSENLELSSTYSLWLIFSPQTSLFLLETQIVCLTAQAVLSCYLPFFFLILQNYYSFFNDRQKDCATYSVRYTSQEHLHCRHFQRYQEFSCCLSGKESSPPFDTSPTQLSGRPTPPGIELCICIWNSYRLAKRTLNSLSHTLLWPDHGKLMARNQFFTYEKAASGTSAGHQAFHCSRGFVSFVHYFFVPSSLARTPSPATSSACVPTHKQEELELHPRSESYGITGITETQWEILHDWKTTTDGYKLLQNDWKERRGGGVALYGEEKFECKGVSQDHKKSIKCLWIKIRGADTKGDLVLGICFQSSNQDGEAGKILLWLLKEVSGQQNLVLRGDFNHPDICCENNTVVVHNSLVRQDQLQLGLHSSCFQLRCW